MFCIVSCLIALALAQLSVTAGLAFLIAAALVDILGSME